MWMSWNAALVLAVGLAIVAVAIRRPAASPEPTRLRSRWRLGSPLEEVDVRQSQGRPILVRATLVVGDRRVRLWAVHTVAPVGAGWQRWGPQLGDLRRWLAEETGPLVVAGDFNATWDHSRFRDLVDSGLSGAAAVRGRPWP